MSVNRMGPPGEVSFLKSCRNCVQIALPFGQSCHFPLKGNANGRKKTVRFANPKVAPGPLALDGEHPSFGQDFQVPGNPRLPHSHYPGQFLNGEFTGQKNRSQAQTTWVS